MSLKMKENDIRDCLYNLLENDSQIRESILNIVKESLSSKEKVEQSYNNDDVHDNGLIAENEILKGQVKILSKNIQDLKNRHQKEIDALNLEYEDMTRKMKAISETNAKLENMLQDEQEMSRKKQEIFSKYEEQFANMIKVYDVYNSLGDDIYYQLQRVLNSSDKKASSIEEMFGFGVQEGNIIALWDVIATNLSLYENSNKLDAMVFLFNYFFERYAAVSYKPIDKYMPEKGEYYDERVHTRTADSNAIGVIEKVILPGFSIGKNVSKKALVRIR